MRRFTQPGDVERTRELVAKVSWRLLYINHVIIIVPSIVFTEL